ncbi:MAG: putative DNA binding domain-containing protein [Planctomycetes bacterium]|nr:putative DNA binding domain-containing protein [Planctomycetota bacterium]
MNAVELLEILRNGENSGVEFKRDDIEPRELSKVLVAFANFEGGMVLLGVEDDGSVSGIRRPSLEEWVMQACRDKIRPEIIPFYETVALEDGRRVAIVRVTGGANRPYALYHHQQSTYCIRVGSIVREASREELQRLFQTSGAVRFELKPVSGSTLADLDRDRLVNYFQEIRAQAVPEATDAPGWEKLLVNTELMVRDADRAVPTVAGMLLFGSRPSRWLPQSGISAMAFPGTAKDYATKDRRVIHGPLVALKRGIQVLSPGIVEEAREFVARNAPATVTVSEKNGKETRPAYPPDAVWEALINALCHRDYTISVTDVELALYHDRLEVISPGGLPNTITVERMKAGCRASRNELIANVMRDYGYVDRMGLGVPTKIIKSMVAHTGREPDLVQDEAKTSFTVRLFR